MRTLGAVVAFIVGWVVLVLLVTTLLPGADEATRALRGVIYIAYVGVAIAVLIRLRRGTRGGQ